jgi:SAM-dependent methyltransferase
MSRWFRTVPFATDHADRRIERWEYRRASRPLTFEVEVRVGKPLDVLALKGASMKETREYADFLAKTARRLYGDVRALQPKANCPICEATESAAALRVFGVAYVRCKDCGHVFVERQPSAEILTQVFTDSDEHASVYVDRAALEVRMKQVIAPKVNWCFETFGRRRGAPRKALDVGAGAGHFLAGAAKHGLEVEGFEKSRASRAFAKEVFGLELRADDFLSAKVEPADLITFWGLLEYLPRPRDFVAAARRSLAPGGMLVVEVPRADCLGTLVQAQDGAVVARHMDPTSHVNAFSDESLCTALVEEGFTPIAAWYFGMDAWELAVQATLRAGDDEVAPRLLELIPAIQRAADLGRQCDDLVVAAVRTEGG